VPRAAGRLAGEGGKDLVLMNSSEHLAADDLVKRGIKSAQYHTAVYISMALIRAILIHQNLGTV